MSKKESYCSMKTYLRSLNETYNWNIGPQDTLFCF